MYRKFLLIMALMAVFNCQAQVSITPAVPPTGVLLKKQLWNISLVNTGDDALFVKLKLTLTNAAGDEAMLTAFTNSFTLPKGAMQLTSAELDPITYQYLSTSITDRDADGFLTVGSYQACYTAC